VGDDSGGGLRGHKDVVVVRFSATFLAADRQVVWAMRSRPLNQTGSAVDPRGGAGGNLDRLQDRAQHSCSALSGRGSTRIVRATKADHLHHSSHESFRGGVAATATGLSQAENTGVISTRSLAAVRATSEGEVQRGRESCHILGTPAPVRRGRARRKGTSRKSATLSGDLCPGDP